MLSGGFLAGYKTYIVAAMGVLGAVAGYLTGDVGLADAVQLMLTAVMGATIRAGVASK